MKKKEAKQVMRDAFAALPEEQRASLRWHAAHETPVLCRKRFSYYTYEGVG